MQLVCHFTAAGTYSYRCTFSGSTHFPHNNCYNETSYQGSVQRTVAENAALVRQVSSLTDRQTDRQHVQRNNKADALAEPRYNAAETKTNCQHGGQSPKRNSSDRTKVTIAWDGGAGEEAEVMNPGHVDCCRHADINCFTESEREQHKGRAQLNCRHGNRRSATVILLCCPVRRYAGTARLLLTEQ